MRLRTFGTLALMSAGESGDDVRIQRRQLALLAALAAAGSAGLSRTQLIGLFWGDTDDERARHALDQLLYASRRAVGGDAVVEGPGSLVLDGNVLASDVAQYQRALDRGDLEAAVAVYSGPFLDGVHIAGAPEFERWVEARRRYFADAFVQALMRLATAASAKGDYARAAAYLRRAAASEPVSGKVALALMRALVQGGEPSAAIDAGRVHASLVRDQLDAEPDPAIQELLAELRTGKTRAPDATRRFPESPGQPSVAAAPAPAPTPVVAGPDSRPVPTRPVMRARTFITLAFTAVAIAVMALGFSKWRGAPRTGVALRARAQLTATGRVSSPAISRDGKSIAYANRNCTPTGCTFSVEVQDVGERAHHPVVEGMGGVYQLEWSPDRLHLRVQGSIDGRYGTYIVSAHGGPAKFLTGGWANFFTGDSLFVGPEGGTPITDSVFWLSAVDLDGVVRDSVRIPTHGGHFYQGTFAVPGTPWFVICIGREVAPTSLWELRVVDRFGRQRDSKAVRANNLRASIDAIWLQLSGDFPNPNPPLARIPFDARSGRMATVMDTVDTHMSAFFYITDNGFDVTADGDYLVVDEESAETAIFALNLRDALRGQFASRSPLLRTSQIADGRISPDGNRLLLNRDVSTASGAETQLSMLPIAGGVESPVVVKGKVIAYRWVDSVTIALLEHDSAAGHGSVRSRFVLEDIHTQVRRSEWSPADPTAWLFDALPGGGWVWTDADSHQIRLQRADDAAPRIYPTPPWLQSVLDLSVSPDGQQLAILGYSAANVDSMQLNVLSLVGGTVVHWATFLVENYEVGWLTDGSVELRISEPDFTWSIYRVRGPGRVERIGTIPRPVGTIRVTRDLTRASVTTRDIHGDAWMFRVAHQ